MRNSLQHQPSLDSLLSLSTNTTYPSTISALTASALGLTDSPRPPPKPQHLLHLHAAEVGAEGLRRSTAGRKSPANQLRQKQSSHALRQSISATSLDFEYHPAAPAGPRVHGASLSQYQVSPTRPRKTGEEPLRRAVARRPSTPPTRPLAQLAYASASGLNHKAEGPRTLGNRSSDSALPAMGGQANPTKGLNTSQIKRKPVPSSEAIPSIAVRVPSSSAPASRPAVARPDLSRLTASQAATRVAPERHRAQQSRSASKTPPPAATADDWEAELSRSAKQLRFGDGDSLVSSRGPAAARARSAPILDATKAASSQRIQEAEWERSGMWNDEREAGRDAEDKARRESGREIARPPDRPRAPIRAVTTGATSVHVGLRPRLHPARYTDSVTRNQPDEQLPLPLFSPVAADVSLGSPSARSSVAGDRHVNASGSTVSGAELLERAKDQYQAWLARKADREAGFGEADGEGPADFQPKNRQRAVPGQVDGISHSEGYGDPRYMPEEYKTKIQAQQEAMRRYMSGQPGGSQSDQDGATSGSAPNSAGVDTPSSADGYWGYGYPYAGAYGWPPVQAAGAVDPGQIENPGWWDPYWYSMMMAQQGQGIPQAGSAEVQDVSATPKAGRQMPTGMEHDPLVQAQYDQAMAEYAA